MNGVGERFEILHSFFSALLGMNANFALGPNFVAKYIYIVSSLEEPDLWLLYRLICMTWFAKRFELMET